MLIIKVQHFLNEEGKKFFPIFIKEMRLAMIDYRKGFLSLKQLIKEDSPEETHFLLKYENFDLLKEFSKTKKHLKLVEKLKSFQLEKQKIEKFFEV